MMSNFEVYGINGSNENYQYVKTLQQNLMFNLIRLPLLPLSYSILFMVNDICFSNLCNNMTVNFNAFWTTVNLLIYSIKLMCKSLLFSCMRIKIQGIFDISQYMFIESIIINQRPLLTYCKHILHIYYQLGLRPVQRI